MSFSPIRSSHTHLHAARVDMLANLRSTTVQLECLCIEDRWPSADTSARHFWHEVLPRIKYRNPALPISITRHDDPAGPAYLHIYTSPATSTQTPATPGTAAAPEAALEAAKPTHTIDVKALHESEILEALVEKTGAVVLRTPPEEAAEMAEIEDFKERAEVDRVEVREKLMKVRREEELLRLARGEASSAS
jgi:large subunit ribosomal protein MRP49